VRSSSSSRQSSWLGHWRSV